MGKQMAEMAMVLFGRPVNPSVRINETVGF
jgi:hypothetical protein